MAKTPPKGSEKPKAKGSSKGTGAPRKKAASPSDKSTHRKLGTPPPETPGPGLVDDSMRRNLIAILCVVIAVALLLIVIIPSDALVASALALGLHKGLGLGAYILPLLFIGIGLLLSSNRVPKTTTKRIILGLGIFYLGLLILMAILSPGAMDANGVSNEIFSDRNTMTHGGLIGSGIGFVLLMLLGFPVALIIALGVLAAGLALIGFSLRKILAAWLAHRAEQRAKLEEELSVMPDGPYIPVSSPGPSWRISNQNSGGASSEPTQLVAAEVKTSRLKDSNSQIQGMQTQLIESPVTDFTFEAPFDPHFEPLPPAFLEDGTQAITPDEVALNAPWETVEMEEILPSEEAAFTEDEDLEPFAAFVSKPLPRTELASSIVGGRRIPEVMGETTAFTRKLGQRPLSELPEINKDNERASKPKKTRKPKAVISEPSQNPDDDFTLPSLALLKTSRAKGTSRAMENELSATAEHLQQTMEDFGIMATVVDWIAGPTVTLFEIDLPPGVRVSRLMALKDDIALALAAQGVRIFAPIPKTHYVGIEVPNSHRQNVLLGDILKSVDGGPLAVAIGKDVEGNPIIEDLARMPHLLIGGTTGSGKSVGINAMIMSILMRATPSQVRFIMIDPKRVEFAPYDGIPHLYVPVVTDPKEAASALSWAVAEMDLRLKTFEGARVRNITTYNDLVLKGTLKKRLEDGSLEPSKIKHPQFVEEPMPYIVIVIDELADLMMNVGKEVEFSISRIAQLARAAGIHLIVATQRPSANVVTGLIKANITTRIAYNVASGLDSRVILDTTGAESLIGLGDLLIAKPEYGKPLRVQGCFTSDEEIAAVVDAVKSQGEPDYHEEILRTNLISLGDSAPDGSSGGGGADDPLLWEAAEMVVATGMASTSNIQRKLKVGYARAGRIMDMLEEKGIVGPPNGSKPRDLMVDALELESLKALEGADGL